MWKFTGKNAHGHVRRAILCGNLQGKRHRHRSQEPFCALRGPRFGWKLRHMLQEPFCMEIYRKSAVPEFQDPHFVWKFAGKNAHGHVRRAILCGNLQEKKAQAQVTGAILWLPGTTFWMEVEAHVTRAILYGNLQEKCRTRIPGTAFCVEIYRKNAGGYFPDPQFVWKFKGKNAHGHCTRAILCGNLQEKYRAPPSPPRSNTGPLSLTVRTPSVWPHCLGNKHILA